jgi:hypothetical protein
VDDFKDIDVTIFSMDDINSTPTNLEDLLGDVVDGDKVEPISITVSDEEIPDEEEILSALYENKAFTTPTLNESVKKIRKMIKRIS